MNQMPVASQPFHITTCSARLAGLVARALRAAAASACLLVLLCLPIVANAASDLTVLLSLPAEHERQAREEIARFFPTEDYQLNIESLDDFIASEPVENASQLGSSEFVLAAGSRSCQYALAKMLSIRVMCVLLSRESFRQITQHSVDDEREKPYTAIVIDQPVKRQVKIASTVFPSLKFFGVLASESNARRELARDCSRVHVSTYDENHALVSQVADLMSGTDALIALPDQQVYSSERLRTVLLTAYGYAKPVIGYSPSYVKAGALISTFTTISQVFRQAAELMQELQDHSTDLLMVYEPQYFSITDNASIAKSLGLVRRFRYSSDRDYTDEDFSS